MLAISTNDIHQIVRRKEVTEAVKEALLLFETGDFIMPDRMHINYIENTFLVMPSIARQLISTKLVSVFPGNREKDLPSLFGILVLNDGKTGEPLALMNGASITALRTGSVGAIGVRYLANNDVKSLSIIGAGVQGRNLALSAVLERDFRQVIIHDIDRKNAQKLASDFTSLLPGIKVVIAKTVEDSLANSEVIITATTSFTPVIPDDISLLDGKLFIGIGSFRPGMREYPDTLFRLVKQVFIDTPYAIAESGDISEPVKNNLVDKSNVITLGKLINKTVKLAPAPTRFFKSVGIALFDLLTAELIYKKALKNGIGLTIKL